MPQGYLSGAFDDVFDGKGIQPTKTQDLRSILAKFSIRYRKIPRFRGISGADDRIRTGDLILTKDALYLLSYISIDNVRIIAQLCGKRKAFCLFFKILIP